MPTCGQYVQNCVENDCGMRDREPATPERTQLVAGSEVTDLCILGLPMFITRHAEEQLKSEHT